MRISRSIVVCILALLPFVTKVQADEPGGKGIFENAEGLFSRSAASGKTEKLSDTAHYQKIDRKSGRIYVLQRWDDTKVWLTLLSCDKSGLLSATRTIEDKQLSEITAIEWVDSLPDGRLFIECHVSPILCVGIAIDLEHGQPLFLTGDGFTWPVSGRHVAYFVDRSRDVPPDAPGKTFQVWIDGKKVRDVPADEFSGLSWDATGTRLTIKLFDSAKAGREIVVNVTDASSVAAASAR